MSNSGLNLTPEQGRLLGQVYAFIIQRAKEKRAAQAQPEKSTVGSLRQSGQQSNNEITSDNASHKKK